MCFARFACVGLVLAGLGGTAGGDCGSIPFYSPVKGIRSIVMDTDPLGSTRVRFDPKNVVVYEPGQRAIVLWNGQEEILLLSTEIKTSEPVSILEVIPFPSRPEVRLGEFETFEKMQGLLVEKSMWKVASGGGVAGVRAPEDAARIDFHEQMGAHNLAVVEVLDAGTFVEWVRGYLTEQGAANPEVRPEFARIVANYIARGCRWFAFDIIDAVDEVQSRQPIEYRFTTDCAYYPLEISTLETGKTRVNLLFVTGSPLTKFPDLAHAVRKDKGVTVTASELEAVSADWAEFMGASNCALQQVRVKGDIRKMKADFVAR